jgi:hypothetical protein
MYLDYSDNGISASDLGLWKLKPFIILNVIQIKS